MEKFAYWKFIAVPVSPIQDVLGTRQFFFSLPNLSLSYLNNWIKIQICVYSCISINFVHFNFALNKADKFTW